MKIIENFDLTSLNTFHLGCRAKYYSVIENQQELLSVLADFRNKTPFVLGGGSNILFMNDINGLVLHNKIKGIDVLDESPSDVIVRAGAGEVWHQLVMFCVERGYAGIENLSLIPGSAGAAPLQNIGAYGVELKDVFFELEAIHIREKYLKRFNGEECKFGYRESVFKHEFKNQFVIVNITLRLSKMQKFNVSYGAIEKQLELMKVKQLNIKDISNAVIAIRQNKLPDPAVFGNAGSFFKNPVISERQFQFLKNRYPQIPHYPFGEQVKISAAWLIEQCGFKGYRSGNVECYPKQPLVIVNLGHATAKEIYSFSEVIVRKVESQFQVRLEREVNVIG